VPASEPIPAYDLQTVQASGRVYVVAPDREIAGRWHTVSKQPDLSHAEAFIDGYRAARADRGW
jgi:hypothetical protein